MNNSYKEKEKKYYSQTRDDLVDYLPAGIKKVLDVGCSNGNFGLRLKHEYNVEEIWGIEPFPESAEEAKKKLDNVINLPVEEALKQVQDNYFDCVFLNDVLEHLTDPYDILISVKKVMKADGFIFASIPNVLQFENIYKIIKERDWKYAPSGIMDKTHLRFFTRKSIERMFKEAGYRIMSVNGINPVVSSKRFKLLNLIIGNKSDDFKFTQFAVLAKKN